jgi:uncharacterized membrane protein
MIDGPFLVLVVVAIVGTGLMAGVSVLRPAQGVAAMNAINAAAVRPAFMAVFTGSAVLSAMIAVVTFVVWPDEGKLELLLGSALYLLGSFGLTIVANVPRNDRLARMTPGAPEAAVYWTAYVREWTLWNHVRAAASAAAPLVYVLALA